MLLLQYGDDYFVAVVTSAMKEVIIAAARTKLICTGLF